MPYINTHVKRIRVRKSDKRILNKAQRYGTQELTSNEREIYNELKRKEKSLTDPINKKFLLFREGSRWRVEDSNGKVLEEFRRNDKPTILRKIKRMYSDRLVISNHGAKKEYDGGYTIEVL